MSKLKDHQSNDTIKMLYIGESGAGKTGSLASLAEAGYNLRILDLDNGLDILAQLLKGKEAINNIDFITCTDKYKTVANKPIPDGQPKAWGKALKSLDNWPELGAVKTWTDKDILVIDSLTLLSNAAMKYVLSINGRIADQPQIQDWGTAMNLIEDLMALLYSDSITCNIIITSHITYIERSGGVSKGYPNTLGNKLPPKIGRYFNTILMAKTKGLGANAKRIIRTTSEGTIDLKHPMVGKLPAELPLDTGLAEFFKTFKGE